MLESQIRAILKSYDKLEVAQNGVNAQALELIKQFKDRAWVDVPPAKIDKLFNKVVGDYEAIGGPMGGIYNSTGGATLEALNRIGHELGYPIGKADISGAWLRMQKQHMNRLTNIWSTEQAGAIQNALFETWKTQDFAGMTAKLRDVAGVPADLRVHYQECIQAVKGKPGNVFKNASKLYKEKYGDLRGAAYRVNRIVRTESAQCYDTLYSDWEQALGSQVIATRFVPEGDACDDCAALAGVYTDNVPLIPVHPNCKCGYEPLIEGYDQKPKDTMDAAKMKKKNGKPYDYRERSKRRSQGSVHIAAK